jgi:hypothetical protein
MTLSPSPVGDGTLKQVLNGVASVEGAFARITFGLFLLGKGNDLPQLKLYSTKSRQMRKFARQAFSLHMFAV